MPYSFGLHPYFTCLGFAAPGLPQAEAAGDEAASGTALRLRDCPNTVFKPTDHGERPPRPSLQRLAVGCRTCWPAPWQEPVRLLDPAAALALGCSPHPPSIWRLNLDRNRALDALPRSLDRPTRRLSQCEPSPGGARETADAEDIAVPLRPQAAIEHPGQKRPTKPALLRNRTPGFTASIQGA